MEANPLEWYLDPKTNFRIPDNRRQMNKIAKQLEYDSIENKFEFMFNCLLSLCRRDKRRHRDFYSYRKLVKLYTNQCHDNKRKVWGNRDDCYVYKPTRAQWSLINLLRSYRPYVDDVNNNISKRIEEQFEKDFPAIINKIRVQIVSN